MLTLTPYENPTYFLILIPALLPIVLLILSGHRVHWYETLVSLLFLYLTFGGKNWQQGLALIFFVVFELLLAMAYNWYRQRANQAGVFYLATLLAISPLLVYKLTPFFFGHAWLGFLGISYLTFKVVQTIMELRDGTLKNFRPGFFLQFICFFPTISSGPIDRYRRFEKDYDTLPTHEQYLSMLARAVHYLFLGLLYNFILSYYFGNLLLPKVKHLALATPGWSWAILGYMYIYSLYLFFNFAGYSLFAVATSLFMGIETPTNFKQPFKSKNIKEFWNRWHISLSFWFRDFVYMRLLFVFMKHKTFKKPKTAANVTYILNMLLMGFWHGETWYYVLYGLIHGVALVINDWWLAKKKRDLKWLPHNRFTDYFAIFITFNFVCFTFLIFSGFLDTLWFHR